MLSSTVENSIAFWLVQVNDPWTALDMNFDTWSAKLKELIIV